MATQDMANVLPRLWDDDLIGVEADHVVIRDGQADLKFRGILLASVAPKVEFDEMRWRELRVYETKGGTRIYTEIGRSLYIGERDKFSARIDDSQKLYKGSDLEKARRDAMTGFFKFSNLAKQLYAKLGASTEEIID